MIGEYADFRSGRRALGRSPLEVVSGAFDRIADEPVAAGPCPLPGESTGESWGALRGKLLGASLPIDTVDSLWGWMIEHARRRWTARGGQAVLACVGLAVPMLGEITGRYAAPASPQRHDAESEIVAAFVRLVREIDLDAAHLWPRLRSATWHAGRSWARAQSAAPLAADLDDGAERYLRRIQIPHGHPDLVLTEAVAAGVITADAAELIAATRLQQQPLTSLTEQLRGSQSYWQAYRHRQPAEHTLAAWLTERARDTAHTSDVEARVLNETLPADALDPTGPPNDNHRARTSARPASRRRNSHTPTQPNPATSSEEARRCA